jgi:uncharacterized protein YbjT (DUF2867 family)
VPRVFRRILWCNGGVVRIAVAGASGFVGRALTAALSTSGHDVLGFSRQPTSIPGAEVRAVDVAHEKSLEKALSGCGAAFYLVHSLSEGDFRSRDRQLAEGFGRAAANAGTKRIIYLGGLGENPSSEHLASRQEVGSLLGASGVAVVELRAAVVLGAGGISFEMLRYLTERLPFMVCPRWVHTKIQPIGLSNLIEYLMGALNVEPGVYEVGGPDVTTYREMITSYASVRGLRRRRILDIPYLTPRLSSYWLDLVTPVDRNVSHSLVESLVTEVVVHDGTRTYDAFGIQPIGLVGSLRAALEDQARSLDAEVLERPDGLRDGVYTMRVSTPSSARAREATEADLDRIGGSYGWYGLEALWRVRAALGRLVGERLRLRAPPAVAPGVAVDWWVVARRSPGELVLRSDAWFPGEGWLAYRHDDREILQVGAFRPKGIPGFLYWKMLQPIHRAVFSSMARHRASSSTMV